MRWHLQTILPSIAIQHRLCVDTQIPKRIDGNQDMANVCVDFAILKALLQVLVDCLIGYFAQQCQIRDSDLLLLGRVEGRLFDYWLSTS